MSHSKSFLKIRELLLNSCHKEAIDILVENIPVGISGQAEIVSLSARYVRYLDARISYDKDPDGLSRELNRITTAILQIAKKYDVSEKPQVDQKGFEEIYRMSSARTAVGKLLIQNYLKGIYKDTTGYERSSGVSRRLVIKVFEELEAAGYAKKAYHRNKACYVLTDQGKKLLTFLNS